MQKLLPIETGFFISHTCFHIRLTDSELNLQQSYDHFKKYKFLIVSQEGDGKEKQFHQHILLADVFTENVEATKTILREVLRQAYPHLKGNKNLSIKLARDKKALASYVMKEGSYLTHGFSDRFIKAAIVLAYRTDTLKKKYKELTDSLSLGQIGLYQYSNQLLELKAQHDQPIYVNHHNAHIVMKAVKHGLMPASHISDDIFEKYSLRRY